jgi:hypothetical protein
VGWGVKVTEEVTELPRPAVFDKESAGFEFDRFADLWDLDSDMEEMTEEDQTGFADHRRRLIRGITRGTLTIDGGGTVRVELKHSNIEGLSHLVLNVPKGDASLSWDRYKKEQNVHKLNAFLGSMSGQPPAMFSKLDGRDLKTVQAVALLFLGS